MDFDFDADTYSASNSRGVVMFNSTEAGIVQQPYVFQSCTIKDLPVPLYYCNNGYALSSLSITDCLVSINTASTIFIAFNGQGWIKDLRLFKQYYLLYGSRICLFCSDERTYSVKL
ncbi:DUF4957 domain-containing protein [Bacteroides thetaiotaomicron]|nr:DUF4957 domain-containing protein [Bacteroides thetaiotaomicron]